MARGSLYPHKPKEPRAGGTSIYTLGNKMSSLNAESTDLETFLERL